MVNKPKGWTSHDVVARVRSILRQAISHELRAVSDKTLKTQNSKLKTPSPKVKVGHTGTLDPLATGLLVLVIGDYTKRAQEFSKLDKTYEVIMKLGATSTTGDAEGEIKNFTPVTGWHPVKPKFSLVEKVIKSFVGQIDQVPPAYSAIKVDGQRAYKLARAGREVKLEARKVKIYEITDVEFILPMVQKSTIVDASTMISEVKFTAKVSSGTYIRSLVENIGTKLGTGAYMTELKRTEVGQFSLKDAHKIDSLTMDVISKELLP